MSKKTKYTFPQLALMNWLLSSDKFRFFAYSSGLDSSNMELYELEKQENTSKHKVIRIDIDVEMTKFLGGRPFVDMQKPLDNGLVHTFNHLYRPNVYAEFLSKVESNFHFSSRIFLPTKSMKEYWQSVGYDDYLKLLEQRKIERESVSRYVIVGKLVTFKPSISQELLDQFPKSMQIPAPKNQGIRPQYFAHVVKETAKRLYLEDVKPLRTITYPETPVIQGYKPNLFVDYDDVIFDNATEELANKLVLIDNEHQEDVNRITNQVISSILPELINLEARLKQKSAEREDAIREAMENTDEPKPRT